MQFRYDGKFCISCEAAIRSHLQAIRLHSKCALLNILTQMSNRQVNMVGLCFSIYIYIYFFFLYFQNLPHPRSFLSPQL